MLIDGTRSGDPVFDPEILAALIDEAARRIARAAPGARVILFGSKARGTDDAESDIDLLVLTSRELTWREREAVVGAFDRAVPGGGFPASHKGVVAVAANGYRLAGPRWEIYGDPDPSSGHFDVQVFWSLVAP